jgi:2EXR family
MSGTTSFTLFPKLPPELRQVVWAIALPSPRLIDPSHPLMSTTRESRQAILKHCELPPDSSESTSFWHDLGRKIILLNEIPFTLGLQHHVPKQTWLRLCESMTVLAVDPFVEYPTCPVPQMIWPHEGASVPTQAKRLAYEASKFRNLQQILLFQRAGSEAHVQELATQLRAEIEVWNNVARRFAMDEVLECPLSCVPVLLLHLPHISCLPYECNKRQDAGPAMKGALRSYRT